jgi:alkyl hydroperoxide reductase subunit AhpC
MTVLNSGRAAALRPGPRPIDEVMIVGSLEEAAGRLAGPAVLVFFSLDCPVCWEEIFEVRYVIEKNSVPVALIGISADSRRDLEPFLARHAFFYPVVSDQGRELFRRFKVRLEPLVVVLEGGRVIHRDNTSEAMNLRREKRTRCLLEISAKRPS